MSTEERVLDLVLRWEELREAGRPVSPEELCRDCPELLPILVKRLRSLESMDSLLHGDQGSVGSGGLNTTPHVGTISIEVPKSAEAPLLPGYEILGELGRGGMGVVYRARQVKAGRVVAVKMILGGPHAGSNDMTRFCAEYEILARLHHPNLVQIYEVGECDYRPYYSMELVEGLALDEKIDGQPQPPREAAEMVEILARTVEVVHRQGIIHRDLKPANILLTPDGIPKVTDFGLAKRLGNGSGPTVSGQVLGTPSYMAPEQASGLTREIGPTVDVYALGVILYEMLLGKPPFLGETPWETMRQVVSNEPIPPRRVQPKVPRNLETICLKCLSKEPWRRYPRAGDLADDLRRFLDGWPPIQARPIGPLERGWKWVRRHTALAALLAISVLTVVGFPAGYLVYGARLSWALHQYEKDRAETNRRQIVRLEIREGNHALEEGDWYTALLWFTEALALDEGDPAQEQMHRIRIGTLRRQLPSLQQYWFHNGPVNHVEFSRDGRRILTASEDKTAQVWDVRTGAAVGPALVHQGAVLDASFSPDGDRVVTASKDGLAQVWSVGTGKPSASTSASRGHGLWRVVQCRWPACPDRLRGRCRAHLGLDLGPTAHAFTVPSGAGARGVVQRRRPARGDGRRRWDRPGLGGTNRSSYQSAAAARSWPDLCGLQSQRPPGGYGGRRPGSSRMGCGYWGTFGRAATASWSSYSCVVQPGRTAHPDGQRRSHGLPVALRHRGTAESGPGAPQRRDLSGL